MISHFEKEQREWAQIHGSLGKSNPRNQSSSKRKSGGDAHVGKVLPFKNSHVGNVGVLLSIDPGLAEIGYAVFKNSVKPYRYGMIITRPSNPLTYRLKYMHYKLRKIIREHNCKHIVMEDFYGSPGMKNRGAVIDVAKAHGATQVLPRSVTLVHAISVRPKQKVRDRHKRKLQAIQLVKKYYGIKLKFGEHHVADAILQGRWFYETKAKKI